MARTKLRDRELPDYTKGEEIFNMVSHIVGGAVGVVAAALCVIMAALRHNVWGVIGGAVYGGTMILLYTMSSIYHGLSPRVATAKKVLQVIDHCAIFLLIAGTYTPIALSSLRAYSTWLGWTVFGFVWAMAVIGIVFNAIDLKQYAAFSMVCYLGMGWCILAAAKATWIALGPGGCAFLFAGGVAYTIGAVIYMALKKKRYGHSVFHLFVVAGSILHFFCILFYVM